MPKKPKQATAGLVDPKPEPTSPQLPASPGKFPDGRSKPARRKNGTFAEGWSGNPGGDAGRARRALNLATINGMADAYRRGGQKAIDQVMKEQPAIFLKMLVLLVPRELEVTTNKGVKGMTDEQLEAAIEALERMLGNRVIDVTPSTSSGEAT